MMSKSVASICFVCAKILVYAWTSSASSECKNILRTTCISADQITSVLVNDIPPSKQLSIRCDYSATLIGWSHSPDGSETTNLLDTSPSKYTVNGNTLTISSINKSDEGLYRCVYELGHTKELCLFVYGSAVFVSCPLGCTDNPISLFVTSGENVTFNATVVFLPGGSCGFKQQLSRVILRKLQSETGSNELLLSCATSQTTACTRGRVSLNRGNTSDSSSELSFNFILSNALHDSDSGLYEIIVEGTHPATGSLTKITKRFQLGVTAIDCGAPAPPQHGHLGPYNGTLQGSRVMFWCESGRLPIGKYTAICTSEGKWSPNPAQFVCSELPPPTGILLLCGMIVWETPDYYCDGILTGYQVQFYDPAADPQTMLIQDVPENRTFYVIKNEDRLGGHLNTAIRVRAMTAMTDGTWSEEMNLANNCSRASEPSDSPSFFLGGTPYSNNSQVCIEKIGVAENALSCRTNHPECCKTSRRGEFFYPNGTMVPIKKAGQGFYRDRGEGEIHLNRVEGIMFPTGKFRCEIPNSSGEMQNLYITLY